jgi:hypothetical protein
MLWGVDDWRTSTGHFRRENFFDNLVNMLSKENPWVHSIFAKLSAFVFLFFSFIPKYTANDLYRKVFGSPFEIGGDYNSDSSNDSDDNFARFEQQCGMDQEEASAENENGNRQDNDDQRAPDIGDHDDQRAPDIGDQLSRYFFQTIVFLR